MNRGDVTSILKGELRSQNNELEDLLFETNVYLKKIIELLGGEIPVFKTPREERAEQERERRIYGREWRREWEDTK